MSVAESAGRTLDSVQLAVITSRFRGIVRQMANTLFRTSRSGVLNIAHDFSCTILTRDAEFLIMADSLPIHIMRGPDIMARTMKDFHPVLQRGDAFLHNSPYHGNSHPGDLAVIVPVVDDQGVHQFTALAKGHLADIGNSMPTTYMPHARDVYEEGALIFPATKVQRNYRDIEDIIRMCMIRIRAPEVWRGDYLAILGAARIGERRILELGADLGWDTLHAYTRDWFDYSERMMDAAVRRMPIGRRTVFAAHDPIPGVVPDGIPIKVTVDVKADEGIVEVDVRDNLDNLPCGLNQSEGTALLHTHLGVFNSVPEEVPTNAGSFRRIRALLREGCVAGYASHPYSCSVATTNVGNRIGNAVSRALAELGEGIGTGEMGGLFPPSFSVISGRDPRNNDAPFVNQLILGAAGGGATPSTDGWLTIGDEGAMGMVWCDSVESDELLYPIVIRERRITPDSEGAGRFRGAPGTYVEFSPLDCEVEANYVSDVCVHPAEGVRGGLAGGRAAQAKRDARGQVTKLPAMATVVLEPGDTIMSYGSGGGGYGPPWERDVERVRHDVAEGWVTAARARLVYGVDLDDAGNVDHVATQSLRARLAAGSIDGASAPSPVSKDRAG